MIEQEYNAFMKLDLTPYIGEWIAIYNRKVVAHGKNFKRVFERTKKKLPIENPLYAFVPPKNFYPLLWKSGPKELTTPTRF